MSSNSRKKNSVDSKGHHLDVKKQQQQAKFSKNELRRGHCIS
jgi:hypothetical protein